MGTLTPPAGSSLYLDANCIIYSVEQIEPYAGLLLPIWQGASSGAFALRTSGLTLLETLVGPLKAGDTALADVYRQLLQRSTDVRLVAVSDVVLEQAAGLRASSGLKTPDAIHAASALVAGCTHLITNDLAFRSVPNLVVVVLSDLIAP
jgi:predicted nucleic acid-binding protein